MVGLVLFQFFGNATRGYVDTPSAFWWWISQWLDPQAETEHGWLIAGVSAWLWWRNWKRGESAAARDGAECGVRRSSEEGRMGGDGRLREATLPAAGAMVAGLGLHVVGFVGQQTRVSIVALLLFAWGVVRLGGGRRAGDAAMFPLGFMVFAIPLNVLDSVGFWLRLWVIDAAGAIADVAGIEIVRSGTQLFSPDGRYQYDVAAACSGVRSLMALAALSLLIGYLNFRSGWRRGLMLALCFPLTYVGNVARIAAIVFAAQIGGQGWGERAHAVMGFGVFAIVLGGVLLAARAMEKRWPEECHTLYDNRAERGRGRVSDEVRVTDDALLAAGLVGEASFGFRRFWWVTVIVILAVAEMFGLARVGAIPRGEAGVRLAADGRNPVELPAFLGTEWIGQRAEVTAVERDILPMDTGFSRRNYVQIGAGRRAVFLSIVLSGRDRTSIHRPELCLVGQGWTITGTGTHRFAWPKSETGATGARLEMKGASSDGRTSEPTAVLEATLLRTERRELTGERKISALVAYWFVNADRVVATHWERALWDTWNRVRHGRADRWAYVLVQADATDGEGAALARMQAVLDETLGVFQVER